MRTLKEMVVGVWAVSVVAAYILLLFIGIIVLSFISFFKKILTRG
jgi:hypothetical protein